MNKIKIYECSICKKFENKKKGEERVRGTRKDVRKHLSEVHLIKGRKNQYGSNKKDFGPSAITSQTLSEEMK